MSASGFRLLIVGSALLSLAVGASAEEAWTLERAVGVALEHSPDTRIARARVEGAQALVEQAQSAWLPQLSISGRYTDTNNPMMAFGSILDQRAFSFALNFNHPGQIDNLDSAGTLAYNLYSGGRATAGREAARAGAMAADYDLRAARQALEAEVVKTALNLMMAREGVTTLEIGVKAYQSAVSAAEARFEAGQLLKADLLSLKVEMARTREALSSARHGAALAARAFRFVLGLDPSEEPVEFDSDDSSLKRLTPPDTRDFSQRPELLGLGARERASAALVTSARAGHRPNVNAFATYQYDHGWQLGRGSDSWLAGVALDMNLFDGGQTSGKIRQAVADLAQVKEMRRKAELGIALEVERARLSHEDALERLSVTEGAVDQAEESASLSRARFDKGALLPAELIGAESRLIEARLRRSVAESDERMAVVDLRRSLGLEPLAQP